MPREIARAGRLLRSRAMNRDLEGKSVLVTGATSGVGEVTAKALAARGARVILTARSPAKATPIVAAIESNGGACEVLSLDLADLRSVADAADRWLSSGPSLDVLVNNAGQAGQRGVSRDGFELTFATNHLGPFLLTEKLLPVLRRSPQGRVVNVASEAHRRVRSIPWDDLRGPTKSRTGFAEYGVSKLCNVLHARELARRLRGTSVTTYALHPGVVATDVWRSMPGPIAWVAKRFMLSPEEGARTQIRCASAAELSAETGQYYDDQRPRRPSRLAQDDALATELYERSLAWISTALGPAAGAR
jgi:retinol dehydrogenase-12